MANKKVARLNWGAFGHASHAPHLVTITYMYVAACIHVCVCVCVYVYMYVYSGHNIMYKENGKKEFQREREVGGRLKHYTCTCIHPPI